MHLSRLAAILAAFASAGALSADTITQWNFNGSSATTVPGGASSPTAAIGTGLASLVGGVTADPSFGNGNANGGSSDPTTTGDFGWQTTGYAAQSTGNLTRGVQFNVSTVGFENITFSFDLRHSNTSSRYEAVQYTINGTDWVNVTFGPTFTGASGDTWFNGRSVDFSSVSGLDNNANAAFRVVASFADTHGAYVASNSASTYAATGTWRFDMVTISGSAIAPIPEPSTYAAIFGGLVLLGAVVRRARQARR